MKKRYAHAQGYGMALLAIFIASMLAITVTIQMNSNRLLSTVVGGSRDSLMARAEAQSAVPLIKTYLQQQLDDGITVGTGYQWVDQPYTMPSDPTSLGGATTVLGTYTATVTQQRGLYYVIKVDAKVGQATDTEYATMKFTAPVVTSTVDCTAIETQIKAGSIASISDDDLISYAQQGCMIKPVPGGLQATPGVVVGTGTTATYGPTCSTSTTQTINLSADAILDMLDTSGGCLRNITTGGGTTTTIKMRDVLNSTASKGISLSGSVPVTVNLDAVTSVGKFNASTYTGSIVFRANNFNQTSSTTHTIGGSGSSTAYIDQIRGGSSTISNGSGDGILLVREVSDPTTLVAYGDGNDQIYFSDFIFGKITGENGDDILSCTGTIGTSGCARVDYEAKVWGEAGNDIISIDGPVRTTTGSAQSVDTQIYGGTGYNIVYVGGIADGDSNYKADVNVTTTGSSLGILGSLGLWSTGTGTSKSQIVASGSNNVLLVPRGTDLSPITVSGFARTLYY